ncbi:MAG: DNA polymerase III subunit alpha, partial [Flavobacteriaceae bacterium]|nr:DNA polymerase III subunit alpha [Flavobacteriaceae bacterium]
MYLIFDTETTGLPKNYNAPLTDFENWPRVIQLAWQLHTLDGNCVAHETLLVKPDGFDIPFGSEQIHGISTALATHEGLALKEVLEKFQEALEQSIYLVGQNVSFDINVLGCEFLRLTGENPLEAIAVLDTCTESTAQRTKISGGPGGKFKLPTLTELYQHLFNESFEEAHNASADVEATARCFFELMRLGHFEPKELGITPQQLNVFINRHQQSVPLLGLNHQNLKKASEKYRKKDQPKLSSSDLDENEERLKSVRFVHLHNHTHFTLLQSPTSPERLAEVAFKQQMPAVALTDNSNMMGAFNFIKAINKLNHSLEAEQTPFKPIVGCELNVCKNHLDKSTKDNGYSIVFIAKNKQGYQNLTKLSSIAQTKGFYYVPRIDKEVLLQYKEDLIVLSGDINGEISNKILNQGENQAEEAVIWWKTHFGENFYIELARHNQDYEPRVNQSLIELAKKHEVPLVATNNSFYAEPEDARAQDILLCIKDNEKISTPVGRGRGYRFGLSNEEYYLKSDAAMKELFKDVPEAVINTQKIADSVEAFQLERDVLLPKFEIPEAFIDAEDENDGGNRGENKYLRHLTYEGAKERYGEQLSEDIQDRLDFELQTIENTGYPGYFLIVWDLIKEARKMGVSVGPGRGSAAGSAVAYCLKITNIDPIKYQLLFERFLNPDRISLPDIDIDFDDELRDKVLQYVIDKYGSNQVAQIITYGTMAAKSSVRDTARVMEMDFTESDKLAKRIPINISLKDIFNKPENELKAAVRSEDFEKILELRQIYDSDSPSGKVLQEAEKLEGSLRNFGVHACGVIITPDDLTNFVPISRAKDSEISVTQFDNKVVESAGLLKMDFLGLKTLSQIRDTLEIIKERHNKNIDIENVPLDDPKTYELFQRGDTVGIFQYESAGMQKYLKSLKPTAFDDLIAMNALYRPGPMDYIPSFVNRKHGIEPIDYDLPEMEEYLSETYGITVYQEQVMLLSQKLAGFTKGEADKLRKAIGKKLRKDIDILKPKFIEQAKAKGHPEEKLEKIWTDWEKFASYAFNKSHSTCYAFIAYQTAYLKAHYPAEFMAATMSGCMNNIKDVTKFMEASRKSGVAILGPDVNESNFKFTVNHKGAIRFGMGAVKG